MKDNSNISQDLLETVERYYNNSMGIDKRTIFEKKLESNPEFKAQIEDIKTLILGIESQALKEQLDEFHKDIPESTSKSNSSKIRFLQFAKYAAAAIIVIALGNYWLFGKPANEKLYAKYFTPDPGLPTTMGESDNYDFYDAMVYYKHGDYKIAISKWEKLYENKQTNDTLNYFLGVAYLANNNQNKAILFLEKVILNETFTFKNDAYYYLGLSYLKTNQQTKAKESFKYCNSKECKEILTNLK